MKGKKKAMKMRTTVTMGTVAVAFYVLAAPAQDMFRVTFTASCKELTTSGGRVTTTTITDKDIVANFNGKATSQLELVYNTGTDSLQIADKNGNIFADVIDFSGGASVADTHQRDRFTFLFIPGITNAIGSAVISENAAKTSGHPSGQRANIVGKLQFALADGTVLGSTNLVSTNGAGFLPPSGSPSSPGGGFFMTSIYDDPTAKICVGTFSTSQIIGLTTTNISVTPTNIVGTNVLTNTNTVANGTGI
jgi:hypothetical protein